MSRSCRDVTARLNTFLLTWKCSYISSASLCRLVAGTIVVEQILVECFGKSAVCCCPVFCRLTSIFPVRAHSSDIAFHSVASMNVLEYLVLIEQTRVLVVDDDLEAKVCLLPD